MTTVTSVEINNNTSIREKQDTVEICYEKKQERQSLVTRSRLNNINRENRDTHT